MAGRCTARVSVSELRAQCRRTNRTSLKRSESHFKRFFSFRMVFLMVVSNEAAERDSGLLSGRSKKDQITDHMIWISLVLRKEIPLAAAERQERSDWVSEEAEFLRCDIRISTHEYYIYFNKLKLTRDKFMVLKIEIHKASNIFLIILCYWKLWVLMIDDVCFSLRVIIIGGQIYGKEPSSLLVLLSYPQFLNIRTH